jgi:lipopolysaccharide/colanic/teichoic acid biosynthesis glycosyltransferase
MSRLSKSFLTIRDEEFIRLALWPLPVGRTSESRTERSVTTRVAAKRTLDITVAVVFLIVLAIPLLLIALAVKLDSSGPVLYRVRRVGFGGHPLTMLKFRKMHDDARGIPLTADADPRLTRVGKLLARTRLDELPQFWDVVRGRMSIVGPRPEAPEFVALHPDAYERILSVRPGITGLSQLAFAEEHSILDQSDLVADYVHRILPQKVGLDTLYAREYGLGMDLKVLTWTAAAMLLGKRVSVHRDTGALSLRRRPRSTPSTAPAPARPNMVAAPSIARARPSMIAAPPMASESATVIAASIATAESPAAERARAA